ncbi:cation diffusion facilitator family transporter [Litorilituus lipolyticus]|uniref:Cation diffusion facilitator family transporter n=1 Tax=Litorilituus lipolyticus TaxID=2491017 RepID=A0A502L5M6_9GAMM|nr:cation diffusion facilitator family transporter [Litorilituus lipolyticus]TPH17755.1 cation diffusion facilitator family transporter [Litorilituus lipolyticus]
MENKTLSSEDYAFWVRLAAIFSTSVALLLVAIKLYAWLVTDSSAMLASTTDSILDLFASVMNIVILRFALAPADKEHSFGHGKAESLAGLVQAAFVLGSAIILIFSGMSRLINPQFIVRSEVAIWVTVAAIVLTIFLVIFQRFVINKTGSIIISGDALHYQSDLFLNLGVLAAIFLSQGIWLQADGAFTIAVAIYLLIGAGKIIFQSVGQLMDRELADEDLEKIREITLAHSQAKGIHELRTRQAGAQRFIQFHLELDDNLSLYEAHAIGDQIEETLLEAFKPCEIFIHHDPSSVVQSELQQQVN